MKTILLIFLLLSSVGLVAAQTEGGWTWISPYPQGNILYASCVAGNRVFFWGEQSTIVSTTDGGDTFIMSPPYAPSGDGAWAGYQSIAFADSLTGYLTDIPKGEFRTTDGGLHWIQVANPYSNIDIVTFANSQIGWKFGGGGGSYKTTNAGLTWSYFNTPFQFNQGGFFSHVYALDQNRVWVLKNGFQGVTGVSGVWFSSNGGTDWQEVNTGLVMDSTLRISNVDLKINVSGLGIAIGYTYSESTSSFVLRTTDFGFSWVKTLVPGVVLRTVLTINDSIWVVYGNESGPSYRPIQLRSTDSGSTWNFVVDPFPGPYYNYFYTAEYTPSEQVILACVSRSIYRSSDLGLTYSKLTNVSDMVVSDFAIDRTSTRGEQLVVAISPTYTTRDYLLSDDGGRTWVRRAIPPNIGNQIYEASIADGVIAIITGNSTLAKSTDKGLTWTRLSIGYSGIMRALNILDSNTIVVTGYPGSMKLFSTSDGGAQWISTPLVNRSWFNELRALPSGQVLGCGMLYDTTAVKGMLFATTDRGFNWHVIEVSEEVGHIVMSSATTGFAVSTYEVYRTTTAGESWAINRSSNTYFTAFSNLAFSDSLHGLLRESYYFVETSNGGTSWQNTQFYVPSWGPIKRMAYNNRGELLVVTESAGFLRYTGGTGTLPNPHQPSSNTTPELFELSQNYPNPFNPSTTITYSIPYTVNVELTVYNILGQQVGTLVDGLEEPGFKAVQFDASKLASGLYFYRLEAGDFSSTKKFLLLK